MNEINGNAIKNDIRFKMKDDKIYSISTKQMNKSMKLLLFTKIKLNIKKM